MRSVCLILTLLGWTTITWADSRLINISTNGFVSASGLIAGFIIHGDGARRVLVLGERFESGIDPIIRVTDLSGETTYASNDNWRDSATAGEVIAGIGREPLHDNAAALAVTLDPGVYLAFLESNNGQTGNGIIAVNIDTRELGTQAYAGEYTGSFTGGDRGTFTATIAADGQITATGNAQGGGPFTATGTVNSSGTLTLSTGSVSTGALFMGTVTSSGTLSGIWSHPFFGSGGTFSANRR
jgi:hypothetical protein